jgi:hypothetical protein
MASKATTDEEDNAVDYQAIAAARIRDAVAEIDTEFTTGVDGYLVRAHERGERIDVGIEWGDTRDSLVDIDQAKKDIINAVMNSEATVRLSGFDSDRPYLTFKSNE